MSLSRSVFGAAVTVLFLLLSCPAYSTGLRCEEPVATTEGSVKGLEAQHYEACAWKGIPYAAPPVGELRWRAPQPPKSRAAPYEAFRFGPSCMQNESFTGGGKSEAFSEDCLTLNIWRPKKSGRFPVMFWIHGGGFSQGAGTYEMYNGAHLASSRDVVVVTINYRLYLFGFLALPELEAEDENKSAGNYGMLDTVRALEWVRDNIENFGGDPGNVTIFGESAGGVAVCNLVASPLGKGLFHRAVMESGACDLVIPLEKGFEQGNAVAEAMGCNGPAVLECLRSKSGQELLDAGIKGFSSSTKIDGHLLRDAPVKVIESGDYNRVPVMVGSNRNEWDMGLLLMGAGLMPRPVVAGMIKDALGKERGKELLRLYPCSEYPTGFRLASAVFTDGFGSRAFQAAEALSARTPVYMYRFDWDEQRYGRLLGAFHGLDIPLVFGNLSFDKSPLRLVFGKKAAERAEPLSETMMDYWADFAKTGDPNDGVPEWPAYDTETRARLHLDSDIHAEAIEGDVLSRYQHFASLAMEELRW